MTGTLESLVAAPLAPVFFPYCRPFGQAISALPVSPSVAVASGTSRRWDNAPRRPAPPRADGQGSSARPRSLQGRDPLAAPERLASEQILELQREGGNRAVSWLLRSAAEPAVQRQAKAAPAEESDTAYWDDVFRLARKRVAAQNWAEAEELLRRIYDDPKFTSSHSPGVALNLALCRHHQGDFAGARRLYREGLASGSYAEIERRVILDNLQAARLRRMPGEGKREAKGEADEAYWDDLFRLARKRIAAQDYAGAQKLLTKIYADPKFTTHHSPGVALNLGLCRHYVGDFATAISLYQEGLTGGSYTGDAREAILDNLRAARLGKPPGSVTLG